MPKRNRIFPVFTLTLDTIAGGGQALGTLEDGRKCFVWGGLPGESVVVQSTKLKSSLVEGVVTEVVTPSSERITPPDADSHLSTSPWQIMAFDAEQRYKSQLISDAFALHHVKLPHAPEIFLASESPEIGIQLQTGVTALGDDAFEVTLTTTVTAKLEVSKKSSCSPGTLI